MSYPRYYARADASATATSGGIGLWGLLGVAFIVLKLCGVITWSWLWVLAPLWIPVALALAFFLGCFLFWCAVCGRKP